MQKALITGASGGLGAALARVLAKQDYEVWLAARRADALAAEVEAIERDGGRAHAVILDVSDPDKTAESVVALDEECDGFDLVVANAGVGGIAKPYAMTWKLSRQTLMTNLVGAAATLVPLIEPMVKRGHGHLVCVSSLNAEVPIPNASQYGASKAGITHMLLAMAPSLRKKGIAVTVIHPGFVRTAMTDGAPFPMPFLMDAERAAEIMAKGIRKRKTMIRFPWQTAFLVSAAVALPRWAREWVFTRAKV
ncbi:MAG: hypothetical protein A2341_22890 [Deltaproteobacteria bacterium RIFOXYB12_FULL_58_9]|nr:MAG: hypothetical protein A2341_22890 [Deltaproteobacteria bacterium RIFOXYB12_FULL_58_9]